MTIVKKISLSLAFILLIFNVSGAQSLSQEWENFLHPKVSQLSSVYATHNFSTDEFSHRGLSIATVSFNKGGILEFGAGYYITKNMPYNLDLIVRPVENLKIQAGIQKLPNLMETNASLTTYPFLTYSQQVSYLGGYKDLSGLSTRGRDSGITIEGTFFKSKDFYVLSVNAGIFNGVGMSLKDIDDKKDFAGRILIQPVRELKIYLGSIVGYYTSTEDDGVKSEPLRKQRFSTALQFERDGWFYRFEGIYGLTDQLESLGVTSYGGKTFASSNTIAVRYDRFQTDIHSAETVTSKFCIGLMHDFGYGITFKGQCEHTFGGGRPELSSNTISIGILYSSSAQL